MADKIIKRSHMYYASPIAESSHDAEKGPRLNQRVRDAHTRLLAYAGGRTGAHCQCANVVPPDLQGEKSRPADRNDSSWLMAQEHPLCYSDAIGLGAINTHIPDGPY